MRVCGLCQGLLCQINRFHLFKALISFIREKKMTKRYQINVRLAYFIIIIIWELFAFLKNGM